MNFSNFSVWSSFHGRKHTAQTYPLNLLRGGRCGLPLVPQVLHDAVDLPLRQINLRRLDLAAAPLNTAGTRA